MTSRGRWRSARSRRTPRAQFRREIRARFRRAQRRRNASDARPTPRRCGTELVKIIEWFKPDVLIGAVGKSPGCFTRDVVQAMLKVQSAKGAAGGRPIIFALSNPKTQAEITAADAYAFSDGKAIFGSGTRFPEVVVDGQVREPGQVNNFFIFPGMSFGAMSCGAKTIPESFFMVAAEAGTPRQSAHPRRRRPASPRLSACCRRGAVANALDAHDIEVESVVPHPNRIRQVAENVATAVVLAAQADGLAATTLGATKAEVAAELRKRMWTPPADRTRPAAPPNRRRSTVNLGELSVCERDMAQH